jgi:hypothetical protein
MMAVVPGCVEMGFRWRQVLVAYGLYLKLYCLPWLLAICFYHGSKELLESACGLWSI